MRSTIERTEGCFGNPDTGYLSCGLYHGFDPTDGDRIGVSRGRTPVWTSDQATVDAVTHGITRSARAEPMPGPDLDEPAAPLKSEHMFGTVDYVRD